MADLMPLNMLDLTDAGDRDLIVERGIHYTELPYFMGMVLDAIDYANIEAIEDAEREACCLVEDMLEIIANPHSAKAREAVIRKANAYLNSR